jgi:predicted metal-dependent peptidase
MENETPIEPANEPAEEPTTNGTTSEVTEPAPDAAEESTECAPIKGKFDAAAELENYVENVDEVLARTGFRLDKHVCRLLQDEPFFAYLSRNCRKVPTVSIPTAGVTVTDGEIVMFYNPEFFSELTDGEVLFVLIHEFYHLTLKHLGGRRRTPHRLWNVATDLASNSIISRHSGKVELPDMALLPGRRPKVEKKPDGERDESEEEKTGKTLADIIADLPTMKSAEWYFDKIRQEAEKNGAGSGMGDDDPFWDDLDSLDDHEMWDDASDDDGGYASEKVRELVRKAVKNADGRNSWGSVPSQTRENIRQIVSKEVDWKALLRQFGGRSRSSGTISSIKRINKKYPYIHPGRRRRRTSRMAVLVDQSGSVGDRSLELAFGELASCTRLTSITVVPFDTAVNESAIFEWKRGQKVKPIRTNCGGTNFDAVTKWVNANKDKYDGALFITDGYAPKPRGCMIKRAWLIVPDGKLQFNTSDTVIHMKWPTDSGGI